MINPNKITDYNMDNWKLSEMFFFCLNVAGKSASMISGKVDDFLSELKTIELKSKPTSWLDYIKQLDLFILEELLHKHKTGKYTLNLSFFRYIKEQDITIEFLRTASVDDLEKIPGIGMKTSRFFITHTRKNTEQLPILDTHILKFISNFYNGPQSHVPKSTPVSKKQYKYWSDFFVEIYKYFRDNGYKKSFAQFDLQIWNYYSTNSYKTESVQEYFFK